MNHKTDKLLKLLFNPGETICVSPNKLAYHSVSQEELLGEFILTPPPDAYRPEPIQSNLSEIQTLAINPISGFRRDENVTAFRSFLVELDDGALQEQFQYVKSLNMPYSVCVFSGSKSLHFGIVLEEDLPDENTYRIFAEWILAIVERADQKTKNPSRGIRCAGNIRKETGKEMLLLDCKERVKFMDLVNWLNQYPDKDPRLKLAARDSSGSFEIHGVPKWVWDKLNFGINEGNGRNNEWFGIFISFSRAGYSYESMIDSLQEYFVPERDFSRREWEGIAKKAAKTIQRGR